MAAINSALFKKIRRIQFQTTRLVDDIFAGAYRSAFKGRGMEFEDVREYQAGDDIRTIDWNVSARMARPFVKSFREERELTVTLVVDVSSSTRFGTSNQLKSNLIAEAAAVLAFSAINTNDKVSLLLFSDTIEKYLPPKKGPRHVLRVVRELLAFSPKNRGTDLGAALTYLGKVQNRSSICFLISDFICAECAHETTLISNKHDLISIAVIDPCELVFPAMGLVAFRDLETGRGQLIDTSSSAMQNSLKEAAEKRLLGHKNLMNRLGADLISLYTDRPYLPELRKFFKIRAKRLR
jgi:uncharacterized protein (DUF58 family)